MQFEDFLNDFSTDVINHQQFLFNAILAAILAYLLGVFYKRYANSIANRTKFADNFVLLTLSTMLVIYVVKSSIALSLGLVGALSIVRFRAAIKEPEELVFLFFAIGIGLGMGAGQVLITVLAFILIICILLTQALLSNRSIVRTPDTMFITISTQELDINTISNILASHFLMVELKRMDQHQDQLDLAFIIETNNIETIVAAKDELIEKAPQLQFSFIEQRNLAL